MFHRDEGQRESGHLTDLASPQPCRVDDVLGVDGALVGHYGPCAVWARFETLDLGVAPDLGPILAGSSGISECGSAGIEVSLVRVPQAPDQGGCVEQGAQLAYLVRGDQLGVQSKHPVPGPFVVQELPPAWGCRQIDAARHVQADVLGRDLLDLLEQPDCVGLER